MLIFSSAAATAYNLQQVPLSVLPLQFQRDITALHSHGHNSHCGVMEGFKHISTLGGWDTDQCTPDLEIHFIRSL